MSSNEQDFQQSHQSPETPVHSYQPPNNNPPFPETNSETSQNVPVIQLYHNNNMISSLPTHPYENSPLPSGFNRLVHNSNVNDKCIPQCDLVGNAMNQSNVFIEERNSSATALLPGPYSLENVSEMAQNEESFTIQGDNANIKTYTELKPVNYVFIKEGKEERTFSATAPLPGPYSLVNVSEMAQNKKSFTNQRDNANIKNYADLKPVIQQITPSKQFYIKGDKIFSALTASTISNETSNITENCNFNYINNSTAPLWIQPQNIHVSDNRVSTQLTRKPSNVFLMQSQPKGQCKQYAVAATQAIHTVPVVPEGQNINVPSQKIAGVVSETVRQNGNSENHEPCKVCGDKSSGNHYGIVSCEGCKGFFRRSVHNNKDLRCAKEGKCTITVKTRNNCPACRLQRCIDCGMDKNLVKKDLHKKRKSNNDGMSAPGAKRLCCKLLDEDSNLLSVNDFSKDISEICDMLSIKLISANEFAAVSNSFTRILSGLQKIATISIRDCDISDVVAFLCRMNADFEDALGNKVNEDYPLLLVLAILHSWFQRDNVTDEEATNLRIIVRDLVEGVERNRANHVF